MIKVVFIGYGNVGSHLFTICNATKGIEVKQIYARTIPKGFLGSVQITTSLEDITPNADVYITALPDNCISKITTQLPFSNKLVVHTSGGTSIEAVGDNNRKGVFYPLQTFSKNTAVDFKNIPICVEAENETDVALLVALGTKISEKVQIINSQERAKLHLAAVFVNNFVNELYSISEDILKKHTLDFSLLKPLIKETARKVESLSPIKAQTGPAKRNDSQTIKKHIDLLEKKNQKKVYNLLTKSIKKRHHKKDE